MARHSVSGAAQPARPAAEGTHGKALRWSAAGIALGVLLASGAASAQVLTVDTSGNGPIAGNGPVDRQYQQVEPTHVELSKTALDTRTRLALVRTMQAEQGFAMRPLPRGHKGLTLEANGKLYPAGEAYLNMVISEGVSAKPGQRVAVTNVKLEGNKIVFDFNGGPDAKHRFLRHVSIGIDPTYDTPVVQGGDDPAGARVTLAFKDHVPELTGPEVKALLAPLVSFDVKTPVQAYTDTLPKPLKEAILNHHVLVGMNTDMVMFALGQPLNKIREMDGQMPIEIWLYGKPPQPVTFVRINGNRVIRVEIARIGKPIEVFDKDVVSPIMMGGSGQAVEAENVRVIQEGDVHRNPDTQAPAPPPTLAKPGETLPDTDKSAGEMKPVHFPKPQPSDQPGVNPDDQQPSSPPAAQPAPSGGAQPPSAPAGTNQSTPTGSSPAPTAGTNPSN